MISMAKALAKAESQPHISTKLHRYLKKVGYSNVTLRDIQQSLSGIGVSLSKQVIGERAFARACTHCTLPVVD